MNKNIQVYNSFSVKLFDTWLIFLCGIILLGLVFGNLFQDVKFALLVSLVVNIIIAAIHVGSSYTKVVLSKNSIMLQSLTKVIHITDLKGIRTWWCYDFGTSSIELYDGSQGKSRAQSNKINCYVKFERDNEEGFICEQKHFLNKFPKGHKYLHNEEVDKTKLIRVWDIDKCIAKLKLDNKRSDYL